jgi:hypothetical protein
MKCLLVVIFTVLLITNVVAQQEQNYLFIGASFFRYFDLPSKFANNYEMLTGDSVFVDGSLRDGAGFYHQIQSNSKLTELLKTTDYDFIIVDCYRLLTPGSVEHMSMALKLLIDLAPRTKKIILVTTVNCYDYYPRYECARISGEVECNIYGNCNEVEDSIIMVSEKLKLNFDKLEVVPFFQLKERIKGLDFVKTADIWAHPSDEMQEILARFLVYWISKSKNSPIHEIDVLNLKASYKTISNVAMEEVFRQMYDLLDLKN